MPDFQREKPKQIVLVPGVNAKISLVNVCHVNSEGPLFSSQGNLE